MRNLDYKEFTRRRRPHFNPTDGTLFLTFRLFGSIPKSEVRFYKAKLDWLHAHFNRIRRLTGSKPSVELDDLLTQIENLNRQWFLKTEDILHRAKQGPIWMADSSIAAKVAENLHRLDGEAYRLDAFSVMSNHVHTVFKPFLSSSDLLSLMCTDVSLVNDHPGLAKIMHSLKGRSARECNLLLGRTGSFWEHESFDHVIRKGKFDKTIRYVLNNPVKAGLVETWEDWPWNYCRDELIVRFKKK